MCVNSSSKVSQAVAKLAHNEEEVIPEFITGNVRAVLSSHSKFWKTIDKEVRLKGKLRPLKLFKHATQSFYSKTKGSVDGATQQRAVLSSFTSHMALEQKIVSQILKTVPLNTLIFWRVFERRNLLHSLEESMSLDSYRNALNKVKSAPGIMFEVSLKLVSYVKSVAEERIEEIREDVR